MSAISSFCRTCMDIVIDNTGRAVNSCSIFETVGLSDKLMLCSNIEIQPYDEYPARVCNKCYIKIHIFCGFQEMCRESMEKFSKMLEKQTTTENYVPKILEVASQDELTNTIGIESYSEADFSGHEIMFGFHSMVRPYDSDEMASNDPLTGTEDGGLLEEIRRENMINRDHDYSQLSAAVGVQSVIGGVDNGEEEQGDANDDDIDERDLDNNNIHSINKTTLNLKMLPNVSRNADDKSKERSFTSTTKCISNKDFIKDTYLNSDTALSEPKPKTVEGLSCDICSQNFFFEHRLNAHIRRHNGLKGYPCPRENCTRAYSRYPELRQHINDHNGIPRQIYKCKFNNCKLEFKYKQYLRHHLAKYHNHGTPLPVCKYVCETCGKLYKTKGSLHTHQYIHVDESLWPFKCDIEGCSKAFRSEKHYKVHKNRHYGIKPYACTYCEKRFCTSTNLRAHINFHTLEKKWTCSFCPKVYYTPADLRIHIRRKHQNNPVIVNAPCRFCNKMFSSYSGRKNHEFLHTGEKRFVCEECGNRYGQPSALRKHKLKHMPGKKFYCGVCNRALPRAIDLKNHERSHTGEKPFECDTCDVKFRYQSNLQRHIRQKPVQTI